MVTILRPGIDFFKLRVGEVTFWLSPLTVWQKKKLSELQQVSKGEVIQRLMEYSDLIVKFSLKKIEGVKTPDGEEFILGLENDELTKESLEAVQTLNEHKQLVDAAFDVLLNRNESGKIKDLITGKVLEGVSMEIETVKKKSNQQG